MTLSGNRQRSYSAEELEEHTGFDRRTIAYYVQEGLLPRVGRRGPRTRYPALVRDRLLFIQRVREAEEMGEIEPLSLSDLRQLFAKLSPSIIFEVADQMAPVRLAVATLAKVADGPAARRSAAARHIAREQSWRAMESTAEYDAGKADEPAPRPLLAASPRSPEPDYEALHYAPDDQFDNEASLLRKPRGTGEEEPSRELIELLGELDRQARQGGVESPEAVESWSRVKITPEIELSARGLRGKGESLLNEVAKRIRRLIK
ncbi:MAG: hypothetical protein OXF82_05940 [Gammaproteobacteria bacterium]|nr:hypothetical protein [Gammaproteobacteria bacterium]